MSVILYHSFGFFACSLGIGEYLVFGPETGRGKGRFRICDPFADERCSQALLDSLATTDVGTGATDTGRGRRCLQRGVGV